MPGVVADEHARAELGLDLEEVAREGARRMLAAALAAEVDASLAGHAAERTSTAGGESHPCQRRGARGSGGVRALQHALYRAAKADPGRRFHARYDKLSHRDVLRRAWEQVTIQQVELYGVDRLLDKLAMALVGGSYDCWRRFGCGFPRQARRRSSGRCRSRW